VQVSGDNEIRLRTYERGVERETLACGTGIISSAITAGFLSLVKAPVSVRVKSGEKLIVDFDFKGSDVENVSLQGSARRVYGGEI
jgi:diaminopimelate epimerase